MGVFNLPCFLPKQSRLWASSTCIFFFLFSSDSFSSVSAALSLLSQFSLFSLFFFLLAAAFNPFTDQNDAASKRKDQSDELSDGAGIGGGEAGGGNSYTITRRSKSSAVSVGEYRKDREEWSDSAIACLLDAYMDKFTQLNPGNMRGQDWEEVAVIVSQRSERQTKSVEQCKNKVDNLKKRYKLERHRMSNCGNSPSHWPWFKRMERERSKKQKREGSKKRKRENKMVRRNMAG